MAIGNYADLQAAVADYLNRTDLTSKIPDFIRLAESKLDRVLRSAESEAIATATTDSQGRLSLPANFRTLRSVVAGTGSASRVLYPVTAADYYIQTRYASGTPTGYMLSGETLYLIPATGPVSITMVYTQGVLPLATNSTTWLLTNHPDVYLYGSLVEAELYLKNPTGAALWDGRFNEAVRQMLTSDVEARWGNGSVSLAAMAP